MAVALTRTPTGPSSKRGWKTSDPTRGVDALTTGRSPHSSALKARVCSGVRTRHWRAPQTRSSASGGICFADAAEAPQISRVTTSVVGRGLIAERCL